MGYLFDTNAVSEILRPRPNTELVEWLSELPREDQYTSSIVVAELFAGAFRSANPDKWIDRIENAVLPVLTVLGFDAACGRTYGEVHAALSKTGKPIGDVDTLIAATALHFGLEVVTANVKHFERVPGLGIRAFTPGRR